MLLLWREPVRSVDSKIQLWTAAPVRLTLRTMHKQQLLRWLLVGISEPASFRDGCDMPCVCSTPSRLKLRVQAVVDP